MKLFVTACFIGSMVLLASCQKEITAEAGSVTGSPNSKSSLVKTYTEDIKSSAIGNSVTTFAITYDASNRVLSMVSTANAGDKFVYQYNANNTYTMDLYVSNVWDIRQIAFIGSNGMLDSSLQYNSTFDTSSERYLYNAAKQLDQTKEYDVTVASGSVLTNTTTYQYDASGNVISERPSSGGATTYTYSSQLNTLNIGQVYFPKNKHLEQTTTRTEGGVTEVLNHAYTFDSNNRLSTETVTKAGAAVVKRTYTY